VINIILADDHAIVRAGIRLALQSDPGIQVIAEAKTGEEAVWLAQQHKPDIVLMDMNMPGTDGFSASLQILHHVTPPKIVIVSSQESFVLQTRLLRLGISGYLSKNVTPEILKKAIHMVHAGENFFDLPCTDTPGISSVLFEKLSDRELQIMLMIVRGMESEEIATRLFLSKKTIHGYHREICKKLGVKKDVELARLVISQGLIDIDSL
jgi:two-component system invasion response regulator UvrY